MCSDLSVVPLCSFYLLLILESPSEGYSHFKNPFIVTQELVAIYNSLEKKQWFGATNDCNMQESDLKLYWGFCNL